MTHRFLLKLLMTYTCCHHAFGYQQDAAGVHVQPMQYMRLWYTQVTCKMCTVGMPLN